jgi:hypothetical protein
MDGLAEDAGIEEAGAGNVFGAIGAGCCGSESQQCEGQQCWSRRLTDVGAQAVGDRDEHSGPPWRYEHVNGLRIVKGFRDF